MRPLRGYVAVGLVLLLAACGSSGSGAPKAAAHPSASAAPTPSPSPSPTTADRALARSLVSVADLPKGYAADAVSQGTRFVVSRTDVPCARKFADALVLRTTGALAPTARAAESFHQASAGPSLRISALHYSKPAVAARIITAVDALRRTCPTFTAATSSAGSTTVTLSPLPLPRMGMQQVSFGCRFARGGRAVQADLAFVRTGAYLAYVVEVTRDVADVPVFQQAAQRQVQRLARLR